MTRRFEVILTSFSSDKCNGQFKFKVARNSFILPRLVLQILFQLQFNLSYQCEIYHRHK